MKRLQRVNAGIYIIFFTFFLLEINAQNTTSPYSILGIGDIQTHDLGRYAATGSASIARRDEYSYNFSNPASLTSLPLKIMNYDIVSRGRTSKYQYPTSDTTTQAGRDFIIQRITLAFRPTNNSAFALGLKPFSKVNYMYANTQTVLDGNSDYVSIVDGSGGINSLYISYAKMLSTKLSTGLTFSWYFGNIRKETTFESSSLALNLKKLEKTGYYGASLTWGLQYHEDTEKKFSQKIGFTLQTGSKLKGQLTTDYLQSDSLVKREIDNTKDFKLPTSITIGYALTFKNKITFSTDFSYSNWAKQSLNYVNSFTNPSFRLSAGAEYSKKRRRYDNKLYEVRYVGIGFTSEKTYLQIAGAALTDYAFTFGGGFAATQNIFINTTIALGMKGENTRNQIKEQYTQFTIGVTLKDIWLGPKYTRRYD
jgi:hypothetical protein